ncbi:hypothetical protein AB0L70_23515 [Kribbella sp. NPDC051952]|uniref:hypothetical protein n=1 Tax=Kribbella sp. NPDC051952 TaxID=3154851 RepID=UPI00343DF98C
MNESTLTVILERAADQIPVGPPPLEALRVGATRRRRRSMVAWSAAGAAAVVAVIAGATLFTALFTHGSRVGEPQPPVASASSEYPLVVRLVKLGRAEVVVPKSWGTNDARCGTPLEDTVLLNDPSAGHLCQVTRPAGVESVELVNGKPRRIDFRADETIQITGVEAQRQRTGCVAQPNNYVPFCTGAVFIPSLNVSVVAQSSTSAAEVDHILSRVRITP